MANVSIEKSDPSDPNSTIIGHIRIRAKSQGMALSLGDKVGGLWRRRAIGASSAIAPVAALVLQIKTLQINHAQKEGKPIERTKSAAAAVPVEA